MVYRFCFRFPPFFPRADSAIKQDVTTETKEGVPFALVQMTWLDHIYQDESW